MSRSIPPLPNTPSWYGAQFKKAHEACYQILAYSPFFKDDDVGGACSTHRRDIIPYKILVGKPEKKTS
jgi:hypothetical protein